LDKWIQGLKENRMKDSLRIGRALIAFSLACVLPATAAEKSELTFAGAAVTPGATVRANVPLDATEKSYAAEGGNAVPANAVAVLAVPPGFDPQKSWPVLVVFSTSDFKRLNRDDLADFYRTAALAEGWVILAGDGPAFPRQDSTGWRAGMTLAALDALHRGFPGSNKWPVACAGYSGGAKRTGLIAPLLALAACRMTGIFLTGINEDRLSEGYRQFKPGSAFLRTPIFVSSGADDKMATPTQQLQVKLSMERTGFQRVRLETFPQGHNVKLAHVREALRWFRQLQTAP
jgi:hypothetical protein